MPLTGQGKGFGKLCRPIDGGFCQMPHKSITGRGNAAHAIASQQNFSVCIFCTEFVRLQFLPRFVVNAAFGPVGNAKQNFVRLCLGGIRQNRQLHTGQLPQRICQLTRGSTVVLPAIFPGKLGCIHN